MSLLQMFAGFLYGKRRKPEPINVTPPKEEVKQFTQKDLKFYFKKRCVNKARRICKGIPHRYRGHIKGCKNHRVMYFFPSLVHVENFCNNQP